MEFADVVRRRRMVRDYDPDRAVDRATVDRVLDHATRAPSAGFSQGWDFLVLTESADRERFWQATTNPDESVDAWLAGMRAAPVLVVCLGNEDAYRDRYAEPDKGITDRRRDFWPVAYWDVDTGMAALLMLLTAVDEELGACLFGVPVEHHGHVRTALDIPTNRSFVGVVSIGYPATDETRLGSSRSRTRRAVDEVAHHGRFGTPWPPPRHP